MLFFYIDKTATSGMCEIKTVVGHVSGIKSLSCWDADVGSNLKQGEPIAYEMQHTWMADRDQFTWFVAQGKYHVVHCLSRLERLKFSLGCVIHWRDQVWSSCFQVETQCRLILHERMRGTDPVSFSLREAWQCMAQSLNCIFPVLDVFVCGTPSGLIDNNKH